MLKRMYLRISGGDSVLGVLDGDGGKGGRGGRNDGVVRSGGVAAPLALRLAVERGVAQTDERSAVGTDVVLVGAELAALSRDALELLLSRSVGVADVHQEALLADGTTVVLQNDVVAILAVVEAREESAGVQKEEGGMNLPSEADATGVAHAVAKDLAGDDLLLAEDNAELLGNIVCQPAPRANNRHEAGDGCRATHHLGHILGQVRDVEVGRTIITLSLETRVEGLLWKVNTVLGRRRMGKRARAKPTS